MDPIAILSKHQSVKIIFSNESKIVGIISEAKVFFSIAKKDNSADKNSKSYETCWYHNGTDSPSLDNRIHLVDILELIDQSLSDDLIFNMSSFINKGV